MVSDLFENGEIEMIRQLKEQVLEQFGEALKTPEEMAEAQEQLAGCCNTCDGFDDNSVR